MITRPRTSDLKIVGLYAGKIIVGVGLLMIVPLVVALLFAEWNVALDFLIGMGACFSAGFLMQLAGQTQRDLNWWHGMVVASFSWLLAMVLGAIPHYLSGHFGSYLDASFDLMSGYTTTGLYLLQDLDHISNGLNTWRHLLTYAGGQGIIVIALTFLVKGTAGAYKMYASEGKEEKLLPNVIQTARAIWLVSLAYLVIGSLALWAAGLLIGLPALRALLHGVWVFMGAWSTGGFAPQSYNIGYYHSLLFEIITIVIFVVGSFNFALHWAVWTGKRREIVRNIEIVSFFITLMLTVTIATVGLAKAGVYTDTMAMFRKGFYHLASGHTTTGFGTIASRQFVVQWGALGMIGTIIAMAIGASAASTAGGFKGLRIGIIFKALIQDVKRVMSPGNAVVASWYHHIKDTMLTDTQVRAAMLVVLSYIGIYSLGSVLGVYYGYDVLSAIFDSVSAGSNTGLSAGLVSPAMPDVLKVVYILQMWMGRLEFMSIFALIGFGIAFVRGK
ncbi:MAG: TrkH family potassium uptake protein [Actinobacteria bacterium]|nr:MAG: TrkH family potassium uptake protein [Actinomycetota bacterium]